MAPQPQTQYRTWCKLCNNFTFHVWHSKTDLVCKTCDLIYTPYKPSEVPKELLTEQRNRFKEKRYIDLKKLLPSNVGYNLLQDMSQAYKIEIIECDAGQKAIDQKIKNDIAEHRQIINEAQNDYDKNYSKLNRNDKCSCGSGKKYKQCHLVIFRNEKLIKV